MRRVVLRSFQSHRDILMLAVAVCDLRAAVPGQLKTDVRTSAAALWEHTPHVTHLLEDQAAIESIGMHYLLIHISNQHPHHLIHDYTQFLEERLGLPKSITQSLFRPIQLSLLNHKVVVE